MKAKKPKVPRNWNGQTYKCPVHGFVTGDQVNEDEIDYGVLEHTCNIKTGKGQYDRCYKPAPYVGYRETPKSKPEWPRPHYINDKGQKVYLS